MTKAEKQIKPRQEPTGCRYITGETNTKDWFYCQAKANGPWCDKHRTVVFRPRENVA